MMGDIQPIEDRQIMNRSSIPSHGFCSSCSQFIMPDTLKTLPCSHSFHSKCLDASFAGTKTLLCPSCGTSAHLSGISKNLLGRHFLSTSVTVRCKESKHAGDDDPDCTWTGALGDLQAHYDKECLYFRTECPSKGCDFNVSRIDLNDHLSSCSYRRVSCPNTDCSWIDSQIKLMDHSSQCPHALVPCPHGCGNISGDTLKRMELYQHIAVCPLVPVRCIFAQAGCDVELARLHQPQHEIDQVGHHMALLMGQQQRERTDRMESIARSNTNTDELIQAMMQNQALLTRRICIIEKKYDHVLKLNKDLLELIEKRDGHTSSKDLESAMKTSQTMMNTDDENTMMNSDEEQRTRMNNDEEQNSRMNNDEEQNSRMNHDEEQNSRMNHDEEENTTMNDDEEQSTRMNNDEEQNMTMNDDEQKNTTTQDHQRAKLKRSSNELDHSEFFSFKVKAPLLKRIFGTNEVVRTRSFRLEDADYYIRLQSGVSIDDKDSIGIFLYLSSSPTDAYVCYRFHVATLANHGANLLSRWSSGTQFKSCHEGAGWCRFLNKEALDEYTNDEGDVCIMIYVRSGQDQSLDFPDQDPAALAINDNHNDESSLYFTFVVKAKSISDIIRTSIPILSMPFRIGPDTFHIGIQRSKRLSSLSMQLCAVPTTSHGTICHRLFVKGIGHDTVDIDYRSGRGRQLNSKVKHWGPIVFVTPSSLSDYTDLYGNVTIVGYVRLGKNLDLTFPEIEPVSLTARL